MASERIGVVTGLQAEARIARRLGWMIAVGGGTAEGAARSAHALVAQGAEALVSFGLAGGLDPALRPGAIVVPETVLVDETRYKTDAHLSSRLRLPLPPLPAWAAKQTKVGGGVTLLGCSALVAKSADKRRIFAETGAIAIDLESGPVARIAAEHGLPFAALRAICDPAERTLPPAALVRLSNRGGIRIGAILASLRREPAQIPALLAVARDAAAARRALLRHVKAIARCAP